MGGFEVSMLLNVMSIRKSSVLCYAARGVSRYINSVRYRSLPSLILYTGLLTMATVLSLGYLYHVAVWQASNIEDVNTFEGHGFCTPEVEITMPLLREVYDDIMNKVLYVGPDTCSLVSGFLDEEDYEAWGVDPFGFDANDSDCRDLVQQGIVRVADIKFPLPYRDSSFSHVVVSDTLEYLSSRYLNSTLAELTRVSSEGVIIYAGYPGFPVSEFTRYSRQAKFRSPSWWRRYLVQRKLEENVAAKKRLKKILKDISYKPACQILLLKSSQDQTVEKI
ncbi:uncharacterized protein At3g49720-like [Momordica charantia]|uniref:Uncharacterized protein At3g49720-like n=1 Tax=Momordica charantia TaxID=3673 RepID=A0A6J1D594_MOMCH|nr:uncharacterized protein At3g49720-like [Momordica charantia]XP_022149265.1 uncharacterized protein At3g49720-like [Momordica charantia]